MTKYYDPDPLGMGLVATLTCVGCGRDRYGEVVSTKEEDVIIVETGPVVQIPNGRCPCGETRIVTGWLTNGGYDDYGLEGDADEPSPTARQAELTEHSDGYWEEHSAPLPDPLAHQFRLSAGDRHWEADFQKMTLSIVRTGELLMSERPVLYDLKRGPNGWLRMRPNQTSLQDMVASIEARLVAHEVAGDAAADERYRARLAGLRRGDWLAIPAVLAPALQEHYRAFIRSIVQLSARDRAR